MNRTELRQLLSIPVIVAALGYFVDIYDLLLFSIIRVQSLQGIGVSANELTDKGLLLISTQMTGMIIGGIVWGVLGDKRGRLSVLFGSILTYSLANIANGLVSTVEQYAVLRFIAGIGLAGELGAGITLVAETLPQQIRGYGTTLVASVGMLGAVLAYFISEIFDWRTCYFIGGFLGLLLLLLRVSVFESAMYAQIRMQKVRTGDFLMLFAKRERFWRYFNAVFIGLPLWFIIGILVTLSPEFGREMGFSVVISAGKAVMFTYLGISLGDILSGLLSQYLQSRKKVVFLFVLLSFLFEVLYLYPLSTQWAGLFYLNCFLLGVAVGYWALFVTIAAEQFGTNLRATVATTVPNFIRGTVPLLSVLFTLSKDYFGMIQGTLWVAVFCTIVPLICLYFLKETFARDLNYIEE
ncbi:MAG: MFS transporter [Microscillaceae bacterium]|nr:MFS transporter [Microscillaceae bacterium]MDW8460223.1 MFS transporter [Cytophagales bacterium]